MACLDLAWLRRYIFRRASAHSPYRANDLLVRLTPEDRRELYERPTKVLLSDAIGPNDPAPGGVRFIIQCECPFSRFAWLKAGTAGSEDVWAKLLIEDVFFGLAGFPVIVRPDRGAAFTGCNSRHTPSLRNNT